MKKLIFISIIFVLIIKSKCHILNYTKHNDSNDIKVFNESREIENNLMNDLDSEDTRVYFDDLAFALKKQNWTREEIPCLNRTLDMLRSLQNFTLWAVWEWDSMSPQPNGVLFGNRYQLGNFDECMMQPWASSHPELKTQYCLADITLEMIDQNVSTTKNAPWDPYHSAGEYIQYHGAQTRRKNKLTWGICTPAVCQPQSVERVVAVMLARGPLGYTGLRPRISVEKECQVVQEATGFNTVFYAFVCVIVSLCTLALICTYLNMNRNEISSHTSETTIMSAFCLITNSKDLLKMHKDGVEVFYGIRFLTICLIVLSHQFGIGNAYAISDGYKADQETSSVLGMFILHNDLFVDTFFFMSGYLLASNLWQAKFIPNPLILILKRYVRLIVGLAVVIFYICAVYPYTGSGPLWPSGVADNIDTCQKNWWLSFLMVNNYVDSENICVVVLWYIPCDFHFYAICVTMYWIYKKTPRLALTCAIVGIVTALVLPGLITYANNLSAVQLFTYEFLSNPRHNKNFQLTYIKSHTRFAAYLVGFFSGCIFSECKNAGNFKLRSQKCSIIGVCTGLLIMLSTMIRGSVYLRTDHHPIEEAAYASLNRPIWAFGLSLLVFCCMFGNVPLVKSFLSWYPWVPLSRLAYGIYLTHTIIIARSELIARNPHQNDLFDHMIRAAGSTFWACIVAYIMWCVVEAPVNKLFMLVLNQKINKHNENTDKPDIGQENHISKNTVANQKYLQENLSNSATTWSKM